jgi:putative hydrolase of the HAD superfamily
LRAIAGITFDYWNTLIRVPPDTEWGDRLEAWVAILHEHGHRPTREEVEAAFDHMREAHDADWRANRLHGAADAVDAFLAKLAYEVPPDGVERLVAVIAEIADNTEVEPTEGIGEVLAELHRDGVRIGIVCDVGLTPSTVLRERLERFDLLRYFHHWSFSDEVGVYKPHPAIFEHALAGLGVEAGAAAHVGDLRRTDVAGARAMGMVTVRYSGAHDDPETEHPEADHVVTHHRDLPHVLLSRQ